jgi:hypothetical protein
MVIRHHKTNLADQLGWKNKVAPNEMTRLMGVNLGKSGCSLNIKPAIPTIYNIVRKIITEFGLIDFCMMNKKISNLRFQISRINRLIIRKLKKEIGYFQQFPLWDFMGTRIKRIQQI